MRISIKIAGALAAVFILLCAAGALVLHRSVLADFERLELRQHNDDIRRVEAGLATVGADIRARVHDYARWDDTYLYLGGDDPGFIAANFDDGWFARYNVDLLVFADEERRILWGRHRSADGALAADQAVFYAALTDARRVNPTVAIPAGGVMWTADGPLAYAARPATRSDGAGEPRGLVVIGRRLEKGALRSATQLDLSFTDMNGAAAGADMQRALSEIALNGTMSSSWIEPRALHALIALRAADGRSVGAIHASRPRDVSMLGRDSVAAAGWIIAGFALIALAALFALLHWLVIGPILRLERHIRAETGSLRPLEGAPAKDEIGALIEAYNALCVRVRAALVAAEDRALVAQHEADRPAKRGKATAA